MILMISHNRLEYLKKAVAGVLNQTVPVEFLIWDNNSDEKTKQWLESSGLNVHFNKTNDSLASVVSKMFTESNDEFVGKVDSDTIVPPNFYERLLEAHSKYHFGYIGGFHFRPEDLRDVQPNIEDFNGVKIWRRKHIGGCAFVIRRKDFKSYKGTGIMGFSEHQEQTDLPNGYLWDPILYVDHMEDKRSIHYIDNVEYNNYKLKTRGMNLERYNASIPHPNDLKNI